MHTDARHLVVAGIRVFGGGHRPARWVACCRDVKAHAEPLPHPADSLGSPKGRMDGGSGES